MEPGQGALRLAATVLVWTQGQAMTFSQNPAALQGLDPTNVLATALIQKRNVILCRIRRAPVHPVLP
jgi:hypothetical protein